MSILSDELANDPLTIGYAGMTVEQKITALNAVNRPLRYMSGSDIFNATADTEYSSLTVTQKSAWDALCAIDTINTTSGVAKSREAELFGNGTQTRANLLALRNNKRSRAQELGIKKVKTYHIVEAS